MQLKSNICVALPLRSSSCEQCESRLIRVRDQERSFIYPICPDCGSLPSRFKIRKSHFGRVYEIRYDSHGRRIKTLDDIYRVGKEIHDLLQIGEFNYENYKRKDGFVISDSLEDVIDKIRPKMNLTEEEKDLFDDFLYPFLADVGLFALSPVHLHMFFRTYSVIRKDAHKRSIIESLFAQLQRIIQWDSAPTETPEIGDELWNQN